MFLSNNKEYLLRYRNIKIQDLDRNIMCEIYLLDRWSILTIDFLHGTVVFEKSLFTDGFSGIYLDCTINKELKTIFIYIITSLLTNHN